MNSFDFHPKLIGFYNTNVFVLLARVSLFNNVGDFVWRRWDSLSLDSFVRASRDLCLCGMFNLRFTLRMVSMFGVHDLLFFLRMVQSVWNA